MISQLGSPGKKRLSPEAASRWRVPEVWQDTLSGGEKTRFKFALGCDEDKPLVFADEPTSNMDMEALLQMEDWFSKHSGAVMLISHDRSFLDNVCNKILEIENGALTLFNGNYSDYRRQKKERVERQHFEYHSYRKEKKRLEGVIAELSGKSQRTRKTPKRMGNSEARLHKMGNQKAKATLDKSTKSVKSRLEQLEEKEKPQREKEMKFDIRKGTTCHSKIIVQGEGLEKAFGSKVLFRNSEFQITKGSKVALIGPNGCGKTTLLEMILNRESGIKVAKSGKVGYFSQDLQSLDEERSILQNVMDQSLYPETFVRILLARLLFTGEDVYKPVKVLSGGERVKTSFAKIIVKDLNLLVLDEPTNYLDIPSIEGVEEALINYDQTLLFVTHDRRLIRSVADHIMTIDNSEIKMYPGGYDAYLEKQRYTGHNQQNKQEAPQQRLILKNRLSEVIGKLSMPSPTEDMEELNREYEKILEKLNKLKG